MRIVNAVAALLALGALLFGVPWFLLQFAPLGHLLSVDWGAALTVGADSQLILALLGVVGWAAWAVLALTIVFEALAVLSRQRIRLRLPGTGWLRPAVGALVLAAVAAPTMASADPAVPPVESVAAGTTEATSASVSEPTADPPEQETPAAPAGRQYVVQAGDELWDVAARELGSGERWRDIVALNPGLGPESRLRPGTVVALPEDEPPPTVVVEEGDTLWHIAESELGDPTRWPEIHAANRAQIEDPDQIDVGWELVLPADAAIREAPAPQAGVDAGPPATVAADDDDVAPAEAPVDAAAQAVAEAFGGGFPVVRDEPADAAVAGQLESPGAEPVSGFEAEREQAPEAGVDGAEDGSADGSGDGSDDGSEYSGLLAPVGAALAGAVLLGVGTRRRAQVLARAVGRRLVPVPEQVARFWTALARRAEDTHAVPEEGGPTSLVLGWDGEDPVALDVEAERGVIFTGEEAPAALGAAVTSLACTPQSASVEVVVVGGPDWVAAFDEPRITGADTTAVGLERLSRLCSERRLAMRQRDLAEVRADADLAGAFAPTVVVFLQPLSPTQLDGVGDALALGAVGVSVLASTGVPPHLPLTEVSVGAESATLRGRAFTPQLVSAPARRALVELFTETSRVDTEPAPWWATDDDLPPNVLPLPRLTCPEEHAMTTLSSPSHPMLHLLGEVELTGAAGTAPTRAAGQCMEYCAWLLQHRGSTPTLMLHDLQVADATRRSNLSRLRAWLGTAPDGALYLPEAYSGRLALDERVSSDWEQFSALLAGGVNVASSTALTTALGMVRGAPLGSFAFQWHWAQQWQADMIAMIVDAACVLADRALELDDHDAAMWAINRGRLGAPLDDALGVREIEALTLAGRRSEAEHAVVRLNRTLRAEGRDLDPALAIRVQQSLHRAQPRRAVGGNHET